MFDLAPIQWLQIADTLAWLAVIFVFSSSVRSMWMREERFADMMAIPIIFIAINQMWASGAWLIFPQKEFIPTELFLWTAVHAFSILCAVAVSLVHRRAVMGINR